ncbi:MAG: TonB-dependent receptor [Sphingomonadaceae bacterium]
MRIAIALATAIVPSISLAEGTGTIVVTGRGLSPPIGTEAYDSIVIGRDRLIATASGRIEDVLRDVAGFQQFRRTDSRAANPTSQGATLRALGGNASSRALVLLDGVPQADPFTGYIPYSALRPERLVQVRVTRGGGAGAFGVGAVAGTIELASGTPADLPPFSARAFGGSRNASELAGGIVQTLGAGFASINAGWDRGDGYVLVPKNQRGAADIPARYDAWSVALRGVGPIGADLEVQASGLIFDDHRLRGAAGTASRSRGADASLKLVGRGAWGFEALAYVQERGFRSGFVATAADRSTTTTTLDQFNTPSLGLGAKIELRPPVGGGIAIRIGTDARMADGTTNEFFRYQAGLATRLRRAGGVNTTIGGFVEASAIAGSLTLTGGLRLDRWSIRNGALSERDLATGADTLALGFSDRAGTRPSFRGGAVFAISDRLDLRAAGYTGFRVPTLNELYRPFRVGADATAANGALDLERLKGFEVGLALRAGGGSLGVTGFSNRLEGAIANVTLGAGPGVFPQVGFVAAGGVFRQRLNADAIAVTGIEASATVPIGNFRLTASYAYTDARVRARGVAAALDGKRPAQTPRHQGSATLGYSPKSGPQASLSVRYAGTQFEDDLQTRALPEALTIDTVIAVPLFDGVRLVARAENLLDEKIVSGMSATGVEDVGTPQTFWLGLTFGR